MKYFVTIGERTLEVDLAGPVPLVDGEPLPVEIASVSETGLRHLLADGESIALVARRGPERGQWQITLRGQPLSVQVVDERTRAIREITGDTAASTGKSLVAPMPGLVVKVDVSVGDAVRAGQGVVIVEAMKMENELRAPADGVVKQVAVEAGQTVEKGALLLILE